MVEIPNISALMANKEVKESKIYQTYLTSKDGEERRVRARIQPDGTHVYFYTEKRAVESSNGLVREEKERKISENEYNSLLNEADSTLYTVMKTRYVFDHEGLTFEMDVYDFETLYATLEVELTSETTEVTLPPFIKIVREVTSDKRFKNKALAKSLALPV